MKTYFMAFALAASIGVHAHQFAGISFNSMAYRYDKNRDGVIEQPEVTNNPVFFEHFDLNKDGEITKPEFNQALRDIQGKTHSHADTPGQHPEDVMLIRDLQYAVEDGESLKLDLYIPNNHVNAPLIMWIHGGGWKKGDKTNINRAILNLSAEGYAVASINYRLKDLSIHPKNIHDCKGALRWLRAHADDYGYDPDRIAVGGGSAGGHLALLLGLSAGFDELEGTVGGNTDESSEVKAIVDFYGPTELSLFSRTHPRFTQAHDFYAEQLEHASPLTYLSEQAPPVIIFHGEEDKTVPVSQSELLHERYQEMGLESHLHILIGEGHGGRAFSDDTRHQQVKAFLDQHLGMN